MSQCTVLNISNPLGGGNAFLGTDEVDSLLCFGVGVLPSPPLERDANALIIYTNKEKVRKMDGKERFQRSQKGIPLG